MDHFTRWSEAFPLMHVTAKAVAQAFLSGWISRFGIPSTIITDCSHQFEYQLWHTLMMSLRSKRGASYLQSTSMVERFHHHLNGVLKAQTRWTLYLRFSSAFECCSRRAYLQLKQRWYMAKPSHYLEPFSIPQQPLPVILPIMCPDSELQCNRFTLSPSRTQLDSKVVDGLSTATHLPLT